MTTTTAVTPETPVHVVVDCETGQEELVPLTAQEVADQQTAQKAAEAAAAAPPPVPTVQSLQAQIQEWVAQGQVLQAQLAEVSGRPEAPGPQAPA